jgi:hypothetical protein
MVSGDDGDETCGWGRTPKALWLIFRHSYSRLDSGRTVGIWRMDWDITNDSNIENGRI